MDRQSRAPLYEALKNYTDSRVVPFDVPGHKGGRLNMELTAFLGENCLKYDYNSSKPLDLLSHPTGVIKEAEELAAEAFGAAAALFMVGGASSCVQAMILSFCKAGDKIIMPRNVHKSALNALVLCGAIPVYVNPSIEKKLGISLGMKLSDVKSAIDKHPDAKAVLVNNPTYYGVCSDLAGIVSYAHSKGVKVLCDEAHGTHFYFGENLPVSAMAAGADMAAVSMHKTGGSLTQSAILLLGSSVDESYVRKIVNLTSTTSPSYLLMSSLDLSRKNLYFNGREMYKKTVELADYARAEISNIGFLPFSKDLTPDDSFFDFDSTKLSVHTRSIGLAGIEVHDILRDEYNIQVEFGDLGNILAIITSGVRILEIERLVAALYEIKRLYSKDPAGLLENDYIVPEVIYSPQKAFYASKRKVEINKAGGCISAEFVMAYPPGIPIIAPGEKISEEIIEYILYSKEKGCRLIGMSDDTLETIMVVE